MLRACHDDNVFCNQNYNGYEEEFISVPSALRRCPSVADLNELNQVERNRLESETGIIIE